MITINELIIIPWHHKADWETPPRQLILLIVNLLLGHLFSCVCVWGGLYIARVSSQKIIAQQVVGNNVHELTKCGSSCEV
jgi:hypothetical protein